MLNTETIVAAPLARTWAHQIADLTTADCLRILQEARRRSVRLLTYVGKVKAVQQKGSCFAARPFLDQKVGN